MRAVLQRVSEARVECGASGGGGHIAHGLVALVGVTHTDDAICAERLADKLLTLRVFDDDAGVANRSCVDVGGGVLLVSQFTLYADTRKGRRPSYRRAADPDHAEPLVAAVAERLRAHGAEVVTGCFGDHMRLALVNDGPFTLNLEV